MPTALVTGATGLLGSHIVERLVGDGWTVRGLARSDGAAAAIRAMGAEPVVGELLDVDALRRAARGMAFVFHTAAAITASGGWERYRRLNVDGTQSMITAAGDAGARLLHVSSVGVYGATGRFQTSGERTSEDTPLGPLPDRSFYARSKRESEQLVMDAHREGRVWATAVRPAVIYGPRDRQFVPRMAQALRLGIMPVIGGGRSTLPIVHAGNVASGCLLAARSDVAGGRAFNLANDSSVTVRDFFRLAGDGLGRRVRFVPIPVAVARAGLGVFRLIDRAVLGGKFAVATEGSLSFISRDNPFTSDRARLELGWTPSITPDVGVPDAFRWWADHQSEETRVGNDG